LYEYLFEFINYIFLKIDTKITVTYYLSNQQIIDTIIILFTSTLFIFESFFSQLSEYNNKAYAQSELIGNASGNNAPTIEIFNLTTAYTIEPVVMNLTAPDSITFDDYGNMYIGEAGYPFTNIPQGSRILKMEPNEISLYLLITS
jgi:hypothetical protein